MSLYMVDANGTLAGAEEATKPVREAVNAALEDRKRFEPTWQSNLAFAAGKFHLKWDRQQRRLVTPKDFYTRERYTADRITEYRMTVLGELGSDDDRPELLLRRDDQPTEDFQHQLNRAVGWGWDYEWLGDEVLEEVRRICLDLGTAACQVRFNPGVGPVMHENVPFANGKPVLDLAQASQLMGNGPTPDVTMGAMQQGAIEWRALSPFNLVVPSGIPHERLFPWEAVRFPVLLSSARDEYGAALGDLREDGDITSILGLDGSSELSDSTSTLGSGEPAGANARLRNHIWLTTYYERPSSAYPQGRTIVFAGNRMKPVKIDNRLPYCRPDGSYCSGIAYFHWWRVTGRFWSRGMVEAMKDPQRSINKRRTQVGEIIDRAMPAILVEENSKAKSRRGLPNELIELRKDERAPTVFSGVSPGPWMREDVEASQEDLEHATGVRGPRLGENPENVTTYAQLALLNENDQVKRQLIYREHRLAIARLVEYSVYDIRTYWGATRQIQLAGEEDSVDAFVFDATKVPTFFAVKVAKGAAKPRSQAAELKKIEEIRDFAALSGAIAADPQAWVEWFRDSLEQGQALELPTLGTGVHEEKARLENEQIENGEPVHAQYYEPLEIHIPIHRELQVRAAIEGDLELWWAIEEHVQEHVIVHMQSEQSLATLAAGAAPPILGTPPGGAPPMQAEEPAPGEEPAPPPA